MNQMVKNTGSKDNNNNSSNSLVFGPWPQTKMGDKASCQMSFIVLRNYGLFKAPLLFKDCIQSRMEAQHPREIILNMSHSLSNKKYRANYAPVSGCALVNKIKRLFCSSKKWMWSVVK